MQGKHPLIKISSPTHTQFLKQKGFTPYGAYCCGKISPPQGSGATIMCPGYSSSPNAGGGCPEDSEEVSDASELEIGATTAANAAAAAKTKKRELVEEEEEEEAEEDCFLCTQCEVFVGKTQKSLDKHLEEEHHIFPLDLNAIGNDEDEICKLPKRGL